MSSPSGRIEVNLVSLLSFAGDLQSHLELMIRDIGDVDALRHAIDDVASLGDFPEARQMTARHQLAVNDVQDLLEEVRDVIAFADDITLWVAAKYADRDQATAASMGDIASTISV